MIDPTTYYVLLTRRSDGERFLYRFAGAPRALDFQRRNRAPMASATDGPPIPSPYDVSELLTQPPTGYSEAQAQAGSEARAEGGAA